MKKASLGFIAVFALFASGCGGNKQCRISWRDEATGVIGRTELMPKKRAVKNIKKAKNLPGFAKSQCEQWLECQY